MPTGNMSTLGFAIENTDSNKISRNDCRLSCVYKTPR